jgi:hypothetical protein
MAAPLRRHVPGSFAFLAAGLLLLSPRPARAAGGLTYQYADYREGGDRIDVTTHSALLEQNVGTDTRVRVQGVVDTIVGATPNGQPAPAGSDQVVLSELDERREAWSADVAHQFSRINVTLGAASSRESDYDSDGLSLNTVTAFNEKNTNVTFGLAGTRDRVKVFFQPDWADKRTTDLILGVNQLLDARTSVTVNLAWGRATGYLSDQYKLVEKRIEVAPGIFLPMTFPENRPPERVRTTFYTALNRAYPDLHGALEGSYRFFHDDYGINSHTLELAWFQRLGTKFILKPWVRLYAQSAADFYHYRLDGTAIVPPFGPPNPAGPYYSSDYRLSELNTVNYALKAIWNPTDRWQFDLQLERYEMNGTDDVTSGSAYPDATIVTAAARFAW